MILMRVEWLNEVEVGTPNEVDPVWPGGPVAVDVVPVVDVEP